MPDVFLHDRQSGETTRISESESGAELAAVQFYARLSADGGTGVFDAQDALMAGDANGVADIYAVRLSPTITVPANTPTLLPPIWSNDVDREGDVLDLLLLEGPQHGTFDGSLGEEDGVTGSVRDVSAPASVVAGAYESDTEIRVFTERYDVLLESDLVVDIDVPDTYTTFGALPTGTIGVL